MKNKNKIKKRRIYKKEDNVYKIYRKEHTYIIKLLEETNDPPINLNDPDFNNMIKMMVFLF
jgi:hypothetical protein